MADLRLWSKELIIDLIEMYKSLPCLWKVKCEEYKNKYYKTTAYKQLVQLCKQRGFPDATRDFVVRKIQSLRGSFRKELRKTRQYQRAGKTYQSNLWYYKNLLFTKDEETEPSEVDDGVQSDDETQHEVNEVYVEDEDKYEVKPTTEIVDVPNYSADYPSQFPQKRRKRNTEDYPQPEFFDIGQGTSKYKDLTEFEITGMSIAKKLARMDTNQAIYAESLINNVIRKGLLKKLKEETDLCENMCGRRILTTMTNVTSNSNEASSISISDITILPKSSIL